MWQGEMLLERKHQTLQSYTGFLPIFAAITVILAVITTIITLYIVSIRTKSSPGPHVGMRAAFSGGMEEKWRRFTHSEFREFLTSFLLKEEILVFDILVSFLVKDGILNPDGGIVDPDMDAGWRNKHRIAEGSGVSHRKVYSKSSIVDRMLELGIVEAKKAKSRWGRQTHVYRLNVNSEFVKSYLKAMYDDRTEKGEVPQ